MSNDLITTNQNAKLALDRTKNLLDITNKILQKNDDDWMVKLWSWADAYSLSNEDFPRDRTSLLNMTTLRLMYLDAAVLPAEIANLKQLENIDLHDFYELPDSITNLKNLKSLTLIWYCCDYQGNNIALINEWVECLRNEGCEVFVDCDYH